MTFGKLIELFVQEKEYGKTGVPNKLSYVEFKV